MALEAIGGWIAGSLAMLGTCLATAIFAKILESLQAMRLT